MSIFPKEERPISGDHRQSCGFTLLEIMVSVAILSMVLTIMVSVLSSSQHLSKNGNSQNNYLGKARAALDLFTRDVKSGLFRSDLAAFKDTTGSAAVCFYTRQPGLGENLRNLSLVVYQLDKSKGCLQRGALPMQWDAPATLVSFGDGTMAQNFSSVTNENMTTGVLRMVVYFIDSAGNVSTTYSDPSKANPTMALGITLAVIDDDTLKLLSSSQLSELTNVNGLLCDDPSSPITQPLKAFWEKRLNTTGAMSGYPQQLRANLRIFERYVQLPIYSKSL